MKHIKAHNIGFLSEKWNVNEDSYPTQDLGDEHSAAVQRQRDDNDRDAEHEDHIKRNAQDAVRQIQTNLVVGMKNGALSSGAAESYIEEIIRQLQELTFE